jgi:hypothetical protein
MDGAAGAGLSFGVNVSALLFWEQPNPMPFGFPGQSVVECYENRKRDSLVSAKFATSEYSARIAFIFI